MRVPERLCRQPPGCWPGVCRRRGRTTQRRREDEREAQDRKGAVRAGPVRDHQGHSIARRSVSRAASPKHSPTSTTIALTECNL